jgi:hypothetical protein
MGTGDSGRCRPIVDFLLAWNADSCGDVVTVFALITHVNSCSDNLGYGTGFKPVLYSWRPDSVD